MPDPSSTPSTHRSGEDQNEWESTRAQTVIATQIQERAGDEADAEDHDIGRQTAPGQREMFVSCDPAEALQQQFDHVQPEFIVLHDIATTTSRRLLAGVATASNRSIQKLVIRRQGYGTPLATLDFIEFAADKHILRIYSTDCDSDSHSRHELAKVLLSYSRLGVLMVGDMPPHQVSSSFAPLHDEMIKNSWRNRNMLMLPLAASSALSGGGTELGRGTGVTVRVTPQITRPAEAWSFISGTWNRLREQVRADTGLSLPTLPGANSNAMPGAPGAPAAAPAAAEPPVPPAPARPSPTLSRSATFEMKPMPPVGDAAQRPADSSLARYLNQLVELTGMVSVAVFDIATGHALLHAGAKPGAHELGQHGAALLAAMTQTSRTLGMGHVLPEAAITLGTHHLLLRAVPHHPGMALHAVMDKTQANLTLVRLQILRMDPMLEG